MKTNQTKGSRGCMFWLGRVVLIGLASLFGLLVIGVIYQVVGSALDARRYPPPGELVDLGGYRLHLYCQGQGEPTVILDHLGDGNSGEWALIQPEVAKTTRVCAYDRPGFGWSDPGPLPRTAGRSAEELHTALQKAGIPGPYILVGHSYGANVARLFAARYPQETGGVVLVDPGIYNSPNLPAEIANTTDQDSSFVDAAPVIARLGLLRLADSLGQSVSTGDLSPEQAAAYRAMRQRTSFWDNLRLVQAGMTETSNEMNAAASLGDLPLIVLSAGQPDSPFRRAWTEFNRQSLSLSTRNEFILVPEADHSSLVTHQAYANQVTNAILSITDQAKAP